MPDFIVEPLFGLLREGVLLLLAALTIMLETVPPNSDGTSPDGKTSGLSVGESRLLVDK